MSDRERRIVSKPGGIGLTRAADRAPEGAEEIRRLWLAGGIEEARLRLVERTQTSLYRFLRALLHDEDAAADLFQESYVKAFQGLGSFRGDSSPTTWILSIARNLALNRIRRQRLESRWRWTPGDPGISGDLPDVADPGGDPLSTLPEPRLRASLQALPPAQREAVILFYLEDLPVEEVARMTGRPANTIKSDLRRARQALQAALGDPAGGARTEEQPR